MSSKERTRYSRNATSSRSITDCLVFLSLHPSPLIFRPTIETQSNISLNVRPSSRDEKHSREGINRPFSRPIPETRLGRKDRSAVVLEKSNCTTIRSSLRGGEERVLRYLTHSIRRAKIRLRFHVSSSFEYNFTPMICIFHVYIIRCGQFSIDPFILSKEKEKFHSWRLKVIGNFRKIKKIVDRR